MDVKHPPGKWEPFKATKPSLQQRARPDMIPHDERHEDFRDRYHAKGAKLKKMDYLGDSSSHVFRGHMDDDTRFIAKAHEHPWEGQGPGREGAQPKEWERRHNAVARLLAHAGAGHMIAPATTADIHGSEAMPDGHPSIRDRGVESAHHHSGKKAFVTEFAKNTANHREGQALAHKVDYEHRAMGAIMHVLTFNSDGHRGNVLINKDTGHPTLIDHDLTMKLGVKRNQIISQFLKGGAYDYMAKGGAIGKKYPPRVKKLLGWLSGQGHHHAEGGLDLHDEDRHVLRGQASLMQEHGFEAAMNEMKKKGVNVTS